MPLKKAIGNMYSWVSHVHTHLAGECPHKCKYCYVQTNPHGVHPKYKGEMRLIQSELDVNYGIGKIIFIEHMQDLFAEGIKHEWIVKILNHCKQYPGNEYVFQTKNPERFFSWYNHNKDNFIRSILIGTTIETNKPLSSISNAPVPLERYLAMKKFKNCGVKIFVTIEPILNFDIDILTGWLIDLKPDFVNIGADSKSCHLPEPSAEKVYQLIKILNENKITVKRKSNLGRVEMTEKQVDVKIRKLEDIFIDIEGCVDKDISVNWDNVIKEIKTLFKEKARECVGFSWHPKTGSYQLGFDDCKRETLANIDSKFK